MNPYRESALVAAVSVCIVAAASPVYASGIVCPVCGQVFDEGTPVCPNDGTDLNLLGKPHDENAHSGEPSSESPASDTDAERGAEMDTAPEENTTANGGYRRHDEDGDRRVIEEKSNEGYSDRRSRLPKDSRTVAPPKRRKHRARAGTPEKKIEDDSGVFTDYEKKRRHLWEARKRAAQLSKQAAEDAARERERLLRSLAAPITALGARVFFMGESNHAGPVSGAEIDLQLVRYRLRAGFSTFLGIRALDVRNELVFLESLSVGVQMPNRFSPFLIAKGGLGMIAANRFETDRAFLVTAFGAEAGLDAWVHPWLSITPSLGFIRCTVNNAYWNSFTFKLSVGF